MSKAQQRKRLKQLEKKLNSQTQSYNPSESVTPKNQPATPEDGQQTPEIINHQKSQSFGEQMGNVKKVVYRNNHLSEIPSQ